MRPPDPAALLADLNPAQRAAVEATTGPVAILAGAGTGKTRVITRRVAYAAATGAADPRRILVVTFTAKAAAEMASRLSALGVPGVAARTFHAAALDQLRFFWPRVTDTPFPGILESKGRLLVPIVGREPAPFRFTPVKDVADAIEWAKIRRLAPAELAGEAARAGRLLPLPEDVLRRVWTSYERAKERAGVLDFEDMLVRTVELLESDAEVAGTVRARYAWFSVDEYQDTNLLQEQLLAAWLGDRRDLCVVGDPDQTIYSFTGASADFLATFDRRYPGTRLVELNENYRSSPAIIALGNRLASPTRSGAPRLVATRDAGPVPRIERCADEEAERQLLVTTIQDLIGRHGLEPAQVAVLVRTNAQVAPLEEALTRVAIPYQVRGERFWARRDVREAVAAVRALGRDALARRTAPLADTLADRWAAALGYEPDAEPDTDAARERQAMFETLLAIAAGLPASPAGAPSADEFLAEVTRRDALERDGSGKGIVLSTIHRAKGLEWDAVLLPGFEEGLLPHASAAKTPLGLDEERRLAYVAVTRAKQHLLIAWAARRRMGRAGRAVAREPSRFLALLAPQAGPRSSAFGIPRPAPRPRERIARPIVPSETDTPLVASLKEWRRGRARDAGVPAYVVLDDATIGQLAAIRPASVPELLRVRGMGPRRTELYGPDILALVADAGRR